jgi:integrase
MCPRRIVGFRDERISAASDRARVPREEWRAAPAVGRARPLSNRTRNKSLTILGGIMEHARKLYGLPSNPVREAEKLRERSDATSFAFYSPEEVHALVRVAASEQDAALFLTAAFTALGRGELIALRWRDVDYERSAVRVAGSYANRALTTPKSGRGRVVPMVPEVAAALAQLSRPGVALDDDDLVFPGEFVIYLDGSALRRRFVAAFCRGVCAGRAAADPFHDLRHTFGTLAMRGAESIVELQNWLGHAEVRTTMRCTHYREQQDAAARLAAAFRSGPATSSAKAVTSSDAGS